MPIVRIAHVGLGGQELEVSASDPLPVIARDTRLIAVNNDTPFEPSLSSGFGGSLTDMFGNTNANVANFGISVPNHVPNIVIPDAWRIRRLVVVYFRTASGGTNVEIGVAIYARLIKADGTPTNWRYLNHANDSAFANEAPARLVIPTSLAGVFGYDQYRLVFRRSPDSTPAPQISDIRVYAEF